LQCEGECFLKDHGRMSDYCRSHPHARVPYKFNRECWGFRVLTNKYAWYVSMYSLERRTALYRLLL
jgi:hypothetical protein